VIFISGGSESDNTAIKGLVDLRLGLGRENDLHQTEEATGMLINSVREMML
jgi:hypothetical protein